MFSLLIARAFIKPACLPAPTQVEKGLLGRKSGKGFYLYPKGKKGGKGGKELNLEAVSLIKAHQKPDGPGASLANDVIQDRMMCRCLAYMESLDVGDRLPREGGPQRGIMARVGRFEGYCQAMARARASQSS